MERWNRDRKSRFWFVQWSHVAIVGGTTVVSSAIFLLGILVGEKLEVEKGGTAESPLLPIQTDRLSLSEATQGDDITFYDVLQSKQGGDSGEAVAGNRDETRESAGDQPASKDSNRSNQERERNWTVQVNAFEERKAADDLAKRLNEKGWDSYVIKVNVQGHTWFRVRAGRFDTWGEAKRLESRMKTEEKFLKAFVTRAS